MTEFDKVSNSVKLQVAPTISCSGLYVEFDRFDEFDMTGKERGGYEPKD